MATAVHSPPRREAPSWETHAGYRPSGLDWAPRVPSHWKVRRIKYVARLETGHTPSRKVSRYWRDCTIPWVSLADVGRFRDGREPYVLDTAEKISELGMANSSARLLPADTVILSRTASIGFPAILARPMATTQDFVNWVCGRELLPKYLYYCLRAMREHFRRITEGSTHQTIYWPDVEALTIPVPPLPEQEAIVELLDAAVAEANRAIDAKQRMIELLGEHRAALIVGAIRSGLDRDAPMRRVDLDWTAEAPAHWTVRRLKYTLSAWRNGVWGEEPSGGKEDTQVVRVADFDRLVRRIAAGKRTLRRIEAEERKGRMLEAEDLLLEKSGGGAKRPVGAVVLWTHEEEAACSNYIARMPVAAGYDPAFLCFLHQALYELRVNVRSIKQSTGIQNLDANQYLAEQAPLPPFEEQLEIAAHLARETERLDGTVETTRRHIELLREYRDAQTFAAVTGRVKVG
jgi:type I restriction enzyme, S subunit